MSANPNEFLKRKMLNSWRLFWLITTPVSMAMVLAMIRTDLSAAAGVSSMIQLSVRCAVPLLFVAFAASSLQVLFPGSFSRWLLRNRKIIGLSFAAAMAWQLFFILWLVGKHTHYYVNDVYVLSDAIEGIIGYTFLIAMVLTSFRFGRRLLTARQWKLLHTGGIYWLWMYAWSVYWFNMFYYQTPAILIDYFYYWGGFLAWALRLAAWGKQQRQRSGGDSGGAYKPLVLLPGIAVLMIGLIGSSFGAAWSPQVYDYLFSFKLVESIDTFMPYFPLVPFYPIVTMALAAVLIAKSEKTLQSTSQRSSRTI